MTEVTDTITSIGENIKKFLEDFQNFQHAVTKDIAHVVKENEELKKRIEALEKK